MGSHAQIYCRFRPRNAKEVRGETFSFVGNTVLSDSSQRFVFDAVLREKSSQENVFNQIGSPCLDGLLEGLNCSIISIGYNQTGKTYTLFGPHALSTLSEEEQKEEQGLVPRMIDALVTRLEARKKSHQSPSLFHYSVKMGCAQILDEKIDDLFSAPEEKQARRDSVSPSLTTGGRSMSIFGRILSPDLSSTPAVIKCTKEVTTTTAQSAIECLKVALEKRQVAHLGANERSSQSHVMVMLTVVQEDCLNNIQRTSRLVLADLCAMGDKQSESFLGPLTQTLDTFMAKSADEKSLFTHPKNWQDTFSKSMVGRILSDFLGGNCQTSFVVHCTRAIESLSHSTRAMELGAKLGRISCVPLFNISDPSLEALHRCIRSLNSQVQITTAELTRVQSLTPEALAAASFQEGVDKIKQGWSAEKLSMETRISTLEQTVQRLTDEKSEAESLIAEANQKAEKALSALEKETSTADQLALKMHKLKVESEAAKKGYEAKILKMQQEADARIAELEKALEEARNGQK